MLTKKRRSSLTAGEFLMFLAGGMFCLILITTAMMGSLLARYTTENQGTDSARVAKFDFDYAIKDNNIEIVYTSVGSGKDSTEVFELTMTNRSEVAVSYDIVITLKQALPAGVSVELYKGSNKDTDLVEGKKLVKAITGDDKILKYEKAGTFPAGVEQSETYLLAFTVDWTLIDFAVNNTDGKPELESVILDFDTDVTMVQVD